MSVETLSDSSESLNILRHKFMEDLEGIFSCPICFEKLAGCHIPQCPQGHHICKSCQQQTNKCPYCKSQFNGTRNYFAETILAKYEEIKFALIGPQSHINQKKTVSVSIQTDSVSESNTGVEILNKDDRKSFINYEVAPKVGKGAYPCKISFCKKELEYECMLSHLKDHHVNELVQERITNSCSYENSWEFTYKIPDILERAIHIPNMGLFFLIISITEKGDLFGNLKIVNTRIVAKEFEYSLEMKTHHKSTIYKGQVLPIRSRTPKNINEKSLFINNLRLLLGREKTFSIHLILNRIL